MEHVFNSILDDLKKVNIKTVINFDEDIIVELEEKEIEIEEFNLKSISSSYEDNPELLDILVKYYVNKTGESYAEGFLNNYLQNIISISNKRFILKTVTVEKEKPKNEDEEVEEIDENE